MHTQVQCTYLRPSLKGTVWINPKKTAGRGLSQIGALSHSHINWQSLYSFKPSAQSRFCFFSGRELGALWNLLLPLDCTKWLVRIGSVCFRASNKLEKFYFQGQTAASKKLRNVLFTPENHHERCSSEGLKCLLLLLRKANTVSHAHAQTHTWYWNVNMLSSPVFRFLSACLPSQRLVPIFPCGRRLIRRTGACFCVGLEHGLDGGNGGPVCRTLSWQKHQTLQQLGTLLRWWLQIHLPRPRDRHWSIHVLGSVGNTYAVVFIQVFIFVSVLSGFI